MVSDIERRRSIHDAAVEHCQRLRPVPVEVIRAPESGVCLDYGSARMRGVAHDRALDVVRQLAEKFNLSSRSVHFFCPIKKGSIST